MKKNAFSLIEIILVVAIIVTLAIIGTPAVLEIIKKMRKESYENLESMMQIAAVEYYDANKELLPWDEGEMVIITLGELIDLGYLKKTSGENDISNKCDNKNSGVIVIRLSSKKYKYTPFINCDEHLSKIYTTDNLILDMPLGNTNFIEKVSNKYGINNGTTNGEDRFGNPYGATSFNGTSNYVEIPNYNTTSNVTITIWVNTPKTASQIIIGDNNTAALGFHSNHIIGYGGTSHRAVGLYGNKFKVNEWNHLAVVVENGTFKYYLNGEALPTQANTNYWSWVKSDYAYLGRRTIKSSSSPYYFQGRLDDLKVYGRALSDEEIYNNYIIEKHFSTH